MYTKLSIKMPPWVDLPSVQPAHDEKAARAPRTVMGRYIHWKIWLIAADCLLLGLQPVLIHMSKRAADSYAYHPLSVNVMVEITKIAFASVLLLTSGMGNASKPKKRRIQVLIAQSRRHIRLLLPAVLYSINGYLKFTMLLFFRPTTAKMLGNLKVLVIALLMRLILQRKFTILQWEALLLLCIGVTINHLHDCSGVGSSIPLAAIVCTAATLIIPSLASTFNEWALKRDLETPIHVQNLFLYLFGLILNSAGLVFVSVANRRTIGSLFAGQSKYTALLIVVTALQGLLSSVFYKYADTVLKKYSSTLATLTTAILSAAFLKHDITLQFFLAVLTIACSMHIFYGKGAPPAQAVMGRYEAEGKTSRGQRAYERVPQGDIENPDNLFGNVPNF